MDLTNPALTFTVALAAGILCQSAARHMRVPGIVVLLVAGALLGPDALGVVRPDTLGHALEMIVGLSVAVILFEGGLNLTIERLRREAHVIRRLITLGAAITLAGGTLAARGVMGWSWPVSILFGTLVIVTGPTVITPLLRRVRVRRNVSTILEAEGVLIDPIGAIVAVVILELVLAETTGGAARGLLGLPSRLVLGTVAGLAGGFIIAGLLRWEELVPEGLENVFTLSLVLVLFEVADSIQPESGIMAATVAGLVVGNVRTRVSRELREFKEQLTVMLVGLLFVLLAADVRLAEVAGLGWRGAVTVLLLMVVLRPLTVFASTAGAGLSWKERAFIGWIGPRGIVAAAVASLFAERLEAAGFEAGTQLRALVFLVIAVTVVVQGLSGDLVARLLGVRRRSNEGYAIVGANALGRALARSLKAAGQEVVLIDINAAETRAAQEEGLRVIYGNANEERVLQRADLEGRRGFIAITPNQGTNLLLAQRAKEVARVPVVYVALERMKASVTAERTAEAGARVLFGRAFDVENWIHMFRHGEAEVQTWRYEGAEETTLGTLEASSDAQPVPRLLPLIYIRGALALPVHEGATVRPGDAVAFGVQTGRDATTPRALGLGEWALLQSPDLQAVEGSSE